MSTPLTVNLALGPRSYDIHIGPDILAQAGHYIAPLPARPKVAVVTDETVHTLHGAALQTSLKQAGIDPFFIIKPAGESQKSFESLQAILNTLFEAGFDRTDTLIAFGGGVIGDLTGFAASIFKRGCPFIQIPTTLLAQVDSSVGGKTAINTIYGKNLVGAFYQPRLVLSDISVLRTLPPRELKAGYAEILKYGLLGDAEFFTWLETHGVAVLSGQTDLLSEAVAVSCRTKARIVAADEHERGQRALLNLGHTFGHALETQAGYGGDLLHGEAVSAGMLMAYEFSRDTGLCADQDVKRLSAHLDQVELIKPEALAPLFQNPDALLTHMNQDKKNTGGALTLILAKAIGEAFVDKNASRDHVHAYLSSLRASFS